LSGQPPYESEARTEQLYRTAEIKALSAIANQAPLEGGPLLLLPDGNRLLGLAFRELERRAIRSRYMPAELLYDAGWSIMLDLLVAELQSRQIRVDSCASRWNLSEATAARQLAALIELNMVMRVFGRSGDEPVLLRLTNNGREVLKKVLALLE
jgi:DNA-binding MarR family transcriptional regulator